ncbi:MAG: RNA polymerase ECF-type sigma factor [uncultured Solirubrobacteraceae bacterium]|uniref:RNA polymerase sigma factor n=1 Tax=uncultured Solirubrobacteraceae bacterium TaxID=1162706 RepID=A0A6J4TVT7_9ACTN|nr:MAG: RNA polymerase ECF-type sigma factor [uncultured Solirubrobacteraceae bacterium]
MPTPNSVEATALRSATVGVRGPTPLLRLQSDERLIALVRRGNHAAFEMLVSRYQARLLAFCRHMLGSREDAEDVLQEVFAASFNAILADDRPINVRPWLYRIARNRSLNHLRRVQPIGVDSMDVHLSEGGVTTADKVHKREDFRLLVGDVQELPETQKTALLLREIDALSYEQIAEAMETTIPSVKSLLVRARVSLAEAAEARTLSCEQVREELGEVAEGLQRSTAPARRHVRGCERCQGFKSQLRTTNKALAAVFPVAPLLLLKKALLTQFGMSASAGAGGAAGAAAATVAATGGTSAMSAGISTIATKTAATLAAAAIVTAGAVEVKHVQTKSAPRAAASATAAPAPAAPVAPEVVAAAQQPTAAAAAKPAPADADDDDDKATKPAASAPVADSKAAAEPVKTAGANATTVPAKSPAETATPTAPVQGVTETTTLSQKPGPPAQTGGAAAPHEPVTAPVAAAQTPVAAVAPPAPAEPNPDATAAAPGTGGMPLRP